MHNLETKEIDAIVRELLKERFNDVRVEPIEIEEDIDADDEPILRVMVSYVPTRDFEGRSVFYGLLRSLRPALSDRGEQRFPVMSFVNAKDNGGFAGAA